MSDNNGIGGFVDDALSAVGLTDDQNNSAQSSTNGKGWRGDAQAHAQAGKKGGQATAESHSEDRNHDGKSDYYQEIGHEGGKAAQQSGKAHQLTDEERSEGGQS